jgi:hypothetical protein
VVDDAKNITKNVVEVIEDITKNVVSKKNARE